MMRPELLVLFVLAALVVPGAAQTDFVNWETPHVAPLAMTPDATTLLAVNTADDRLEVFDLTGPLPVQTASIPVGLDPVSVRARTNGEAWVVNQVSDTVSVVDLAAGAVTRTLETDDEPADVVFAGTPQRAFVTCSQANTVLVFDPVNPAAAPVRIAIDGEDPRALAVSADGSRVYAAVFESGNGTTVLTGASINSMGFPNAVSHPMGPYGGLNPPPNDGAGFNPPLNPSNPPPPEVSLIVQRETASRWVDDNGMNWHLFVAGPLAPFASRAPGWDLLDHDVAVIDTGTLGVTYADGAMNICMALAVHPVSGEITVVGTDATNVIRYEPNLKGTFVRSHLARIDDQTLAVQSVADMNPHLDYLTPRIAPAQRELAVGDPRGITWNAAGTTAYVTGMGSNNVIMLDATGQRTGQRPTIEVGEGPTGLALDEGRQRLYVLDKFEGALSVVDTAGELEVARLPFFDPTPEAIVTGRRHLYSTHDSSGLGQISCASCHVDARMDRLAWDLGDPSAAVTPLPSTLNLAMGAPGQAQLFTDFHPMKGPMTTQTLQDIIGKEPLHWRGDKNRLADFAGAYVGLQGFDVARSEAEMQEFSDFLASIHFPPNPFREIDNSLPTNVPLPGHVSAGRFSPPGTPLPNGDATRGLALMRPPTMAFEHQADCVLCHTLPTGAGSDHTLGAGANYVPIPPGPNGERHLAVFATGGVAQSTTKAPQLRSLYEKVGFDLFGPSRAGTGFVHDGSVGALSVVLSQPAFKFNNDQELADVLAFLLSLTGSDLPTGSPTNIFEPPGVSSQDSHAAVGRQVTLRGPMPAAGDLALAQMLTTLADGGVVGLVARARQGGLARGFRYDGSGMLQSDRVAETITFPQLVALATATDAVTLTVVPAGSETRIGIDRDRDGHLDRDELDAGSDPANPASTPGAAALPRPAPPAAVTATPQSYSRVDLAWTGPATPHDGFRIERSTSLGGGFELIAQLSAATTAFTDGGLACGVEHFYRIRAVNAAGASGFAQVAVITGSCPAGQVVRVQEMAVTLQSVGRAAQVEGTITVTDQNLVPVSGLTVTAFWTESPAMVLTATTDAQGVALFKTPTTGFSPRCRTLNVQGISGLGVLYDAAANVVTSASAGIGCP